MLAMLASGGLTLVYSFGSRGAVSVRAERAAPLMVIADGATQLFHAGGQIESLPFMLQANLVQAGHAPSEP